MFLPFTEMANSSQMHEEEAEEVLLDSFPGTADTQNNTCFEVVVEKKEAASYCDDKHHRKLAVCSIICGISCIGIKALIYSVKVFNCLSPVSPNVTALKLYFTKSPKAALNSSQVTLLQT